MGCDGTGDLGHFDGMGQAIAEVVREAAGEDLGLGFQAAKSAGVDDTVAVALEIVAIGMLGFRNAASAGLLHPHGVVGQHGGKFSIVRGSTQHSISTQHSAIRQNSAVASSDR